MISIWMWPKSTLFRVSVKRWGHACERSRLQTIYVQVPDQPACALSTHLSLNTAAAPFLYLDGKSAIPRTDNEPPNSGGPILATIKTLQHL